MNVEISVPVANVKPIRYARTIVLSILLFAAGGALTLFWTDRGATVSVQVTDTKGLRIGASVVCDGAPVGKVEKISHAAEGVQIGIKLKGSAAKTIQYRRSGSRYWLVSPTASLRSLEGLNGIMRPTYVEVASGDGQEQESFVGLAAAPIVKNIGPKDIEILVRSSTFGSLRAGAPLLYRQGEIGRITDVQFVEDGRVVESRVYVPERFAYLIQANSMFWDAGGAEFSVGLRGASLNIDSPEALFSGAMAMTNPYGVGERAPPGSIFMILAKAPVVPYPEANDLEFVLTTPVTRGVKPNSPVRYRQHDVGVVTSVEPAANGGGMEVRVLIKQRYTPYVCQKTQFWDSSGVTLSGFQLSFDSAESLLSGGICFATPEDCGPQAGQGSRFLLAEKAPRGWEGWTPKLSSLAQAR